MTELPASVDRDILERRIIPALRTIRDTLDCSIHKALDVFIVRYEELRRDHPNDFTVGREAYGEGFYS